MNENFIERKFVRLCKRHGMHVMKMSTQFEQGIPDRMVLYKGHAGFAEIKAPGKKPRPVQQAYMRKLEKQGCFVGVVDHPNGVIGWIGNFFNHINSKTSHKQKSKAEEMNRRADSVYRVDSTQLSKQYSQ